MMDRWVIARLRPGLEAGARGLVRLGIGADAVTWAGFVIGVVAAACISQQAFAVGLVLLLVSRLLDGLDGAVARLTQPTDRGAFLDITLDFLFYASIPLARRCWLPSSAPARASWPSPSWPSAAGWPAPPTRPRASSIWAA